MTVMLTEVFLNQLDAVSDNAYVVALTPSGLIVGSAQVYGLNQTHLPVWADNEVTEDEIDGATQGESVVFQLIDGTDLFDLTMNSSVTYATDGLVFPSLDTKSLVVCHSPIEN